jgi:hypothetical protein
LRTVIIVTRRLLFALALITSLAASARAGVNDFPEEWLPKQPTLRLIIAGDSGGTHTRLLDGFYAVEKQMKIDAIILVGDNFYPCGVKSLSDPEWSKVKEHFLPTGLPIYPLLGNHDYGDPEPKPHNAGYVVCGSPNPQAEIAASKTIPRWHFPARSYLLRSALVDFIMTDTQPIASGFKSPFLGSLTGDQEKTWLSEALYRARGKWTIVVGHHTIYSSGLHGVANGADQRNMRALLPLFRERHVDAYIDGHDHDLELLGDLQRKNGDPVFLISGAASDIYQLAPRSTADEPPTLYPHLPAKPYYGFAVLEVTEAQLTIRFYDEKGTMQGGPFVVPARAKPAAATVTPAR